MPNSKFPLAPKLESALIPTPYTPDSLYAHKCDLLNLGFVFQQSGLRLSSLLWVDNLFVLAVALLAHAAARLTAKGEAVSPLEWLD